MRSLDRASTALLASGVVLITTNIIWYYKHMSALPRPQESLSSVIYVTPGLIGFILVLVSLVFEEYKTTGKWGQAVVGALASLSLVGFIILFRLLFGPK